MPLRAPPSLYAGTSQRARVRATAPVRASCATASPCSVIGDLLSWCWPAVGPGSHPVRPSPHRHPQPLRRRPSRGHICSAPTRSAAIFWCAC